MKKTLLPFLLLMFIAACTGKNDPADTSAIEQQTIQHDTVGLAAFQEWKQQQPMIESQDMKEMVSHSTLGIENMPKPRVVGNLKGRRIDVKPRVIYKEPSVVYTKPTVDAPSENNTASRKAVYRANSNEAGNDSASTEMGKAVEPAVVSKPEEVPSPQKKEGWSKAAKGTVIGAASGAVLGAIVSKNKGKGALIGGVIGAAGGYIFGRSKDKKDGRY